MSREALLLFRDSLRLNNNVEAFFKPTVRDAVIEAVGAWRAERIFGPSEPETIKVRKPKLYEVGKPLPAGWWK